MTTTPTTFRAAFRVDGMPKGQPRPKAFVRGKHAGVYDPGTAGEWKAKVCEAGRPHRPDAPLECALSVRMDFLMPRPKRLKPGRVEFHTGKSDVDNLAKAVMDALTVDGWMRDDAQVVRLVVSKRYASADERPGMLVGVWQAEHYELNTF